MEEKTPEKVPIKFQDLTKMKDHFTIEFYTPQENPLSIVAHRELDSESMAHINPYAEENKKYITTYEIIFPTFLTFSVIGDYIGMANCAEDDVYEGDSFRVYSKSAYYDLINKDINFKEHFSGKEMIHYGFMDLFWQIDIISSTPPIVKEIKLKKGILLG